MPHPMTEAEALRDLAGAEEDLRREQQWLAHTPTALVGSYLDQLRAEVTRCRAALAESQKEEK